MPNPTLDLFAADPHTSHVFLAPGAWVLHGFALPGAAQLMSEIESITARAPFRHQKTPGGLRMSVGMTNCGSLGWVSDAQGYRYESADPKTGRRWPALPRAFLELASRAAMAAGYPGFVPDACLINRYVPGARLTLHQDRDERDLSAPIVSVSLGLPATFLFGGNARADHQRRVPLSHGDVVIWGGAARLRHHGVLPLKDGHHERLGVQRINLTFRLAG